MRGLLLAISLIGVTGLAFAGEPQKQTNLPVAQKHETQVVASVRTPQKMTDEQLEGIVAGSSARGLVLENNGGQFGVPSCRASRGISSGYGQSTTVSQSYCD